MNLQFLELKNYNNVRGELDPNRDYYGTSNYTRLMEQSNAKFENQFTNNKKDSMNYKTIEPTKIEGLGLRRSKRRKKKFKFILDDEDSKDYKGNESLKQLVKNMALKKEKELLKEEEKNIKRQKELFNLLGIQ